MISQKRGKIKRRRLDLALDYIDREITNLEKRKGELEEMSERLIAREEYLERENTFSNIS